MSSGLVEPTRKEVNMESFAKLTTVTGIVKAERDEVSQSRDCDNCLGDPDCNS